MSEKFTVAATTCAHNDRARANLAPKPAMNLS